MNKWAGLWESVKLTMGGKSLDRLYIDKDENDGDDDDDIDEDSHDVN